MDPTKTRIWNADQLGLPAPKAGEAAPNVFRPPAVARADATRVFVAPRRGEDTLPSHRRVQAPREPDGAAVPVRARRSVPPPPPPPRRARASVPPPAPSTLTARWSPHAPAPSPMAATRIMPIELLLPRTQPTSPQPTAADTLVIPKPRFRALKRVAGHVALATLTVLAVALWKLPLRQYVRARITSAAPAANADAERARELRSAASGDARAMNAVSAQEPLVAAAHDGRLGDVQAPVAAAHDGALGDARAVNVAPLPAAAHDGLLADGVRAGAARRRGGAAAQARALSPQRHAVELVIGGDFAGAEQAYIELASAHPDGQAYREAARILAARRDK